MQVEGTVATALPVETKSKSNSILAKEGASATTTLTAVTANTSINAAGLIDKDGISMTMIPMKKNKHRTEDSLEGSLDGDDGDEQGEQKEQESLELRLTSVPLAKDGTKDKEGKEGKEGNKDKEGKGGKDGKGDDAYTMSLAAKAAADARHTETR